MHLNPGLLVHTHLHVSCLALRDEQDVHKSATHVTGKPGFRVCANKHLFISIWGGKAALDKQGVKEPCKYTIFRLFGFMQRSWQVAGAISGCSGQQTGQLLSPQMAPLWPPTPDICNYKQGLCRKEMESSMKTQQAAGELRHQLVPPDGGRDSTKP